MTAPPFVGLTGGIGAGKSEALAALERLGASVISTDKVVHELYADPEVIAAVVERWGAEVAPEGVVDRAAIARSAFVDDTERHFLESLLWPRVGARVAQWREREAAKGPRALVVETPLLFEAGLDGMLRRDDRDRRRRGGPRRARRRSRACGARRAHRAPAPTG